MKYLQNLPQSLIEKIVQICLLDDIEIYDLELAQSIVKEFPKQPESWVWLGRIQYKLTIDIEEDEDDSILEGEVVYADFLKTLAHLQQNFPKYAGTIWLEVLDSLTDEDQSYKDAIQLALKGLKIEPHYFGLHLTIADLYQWEDQLEKSKNHLQECIKILDKSFRAAYDLACLLKRLGQLEEALEIAQLPNTQLYHGYAVGYNLGNFVAKDNDEMAERFFASAQEKMGHHNAVLHNRALCLERLNKYQQAIDLWKLALKNSPDWLEPIYGITRSYKNSGNYLLALEYAKMGQSVEAEDQWPRWYESLIYVKQNQFNKAIEIMNHLENENFVDTVGQCVEKGRCHVQLIQYPQALIAFYKAIQINPEITSPYLEISKMLAQKKLPSLEDKKMALAYAQAALAGNPSYSTGILNLVNVLESIGQQQEAIAEIAQWIDRNEIQYPVLIKYGQLLLAHKNYKSAEKIYELLLKNYEDDGDMAWGRAICYGKLNQNKKANIAITAALDFYKKDNNIEALSRCTKLKNEIQNGGVLMSF